MVEIAIVIVNYNVSYLLERCLRTVFATDRPIELAVCVVDNNSTDDSCEMVERSFPQVQLIRNEDNVGFPKANNQGLSLLGVDRGEARYYLLLNPDTELQPNTLSTLLTYMDKEPKVGIVGPRLLLSNGQLDHACRRGFPTPSASFFYMSGLDRLFPKSTRLGQYRLSYLDEHQEADVDAVTGAFMFIRREAIEQVGLLDEQFWMYGEDLDWAKRIKDGGWRIVYQPAAEALHVKGASSRQNKKAQVEFYRAMLIFYRKHYEAETNWFLHAFVILGLALRGGRPIWSDLGWV